MQSYLYKLTVAVALTAMILTTAGCLKDSCNSSYPSKVYIPVYKSLSDLRNAVRSEAPRDIENAGKIWLYGHFIFLNELNKGIHIIDNTNPSAPQKIAFINIPGNVDMAVKGNVLYADSYVDLVALDITDPHHISEAKRLNNVFPARQYDYGIRIDTNQGIIIAFIERDTVLTNACQYSTWQTGGFMYDALSNTAVVSGNKSSTSMALGKGGSTARFALMNNYLYTVDIMGLQAFNVQQPLQPVKRNNISISGHVETIFPYGSNLFIGSQNGMFIYDAGTPDYPALKGQFQHATACDPVVVEDNIAYVTLRDGVTCRNGQSIVLNQLDVLDVQNLSQPRLLKSYPMTSPHGLGIDQGKLFICEGNKGLRFMNAANVQDIVTAKLLEGIEAYDVIPHDNVLLVTAKDGLYQYDYTDLQQPRLLSKLTITVKQ